MMSFFTLFYFQHIINERFLICSYCLVGHVRDGCSDPPESDDNFCRVCLSSFPTPSPLAPPVWRPRPGQWRKWRLPSLTPQPTCLRLFAVVVVAFAVASTAQAKAAAFALVSDAAAVAAVAFAAVVEFCRRFFPLTVSLFPCFCL